MAKEYGLSEAVEAIAQQAIPVFHPHLATARIVYLNVDKGSRKAGKPVLGKVKKISGSLEFLLEKDFMIEVALEFGRGGGRLVGDLVERGSRFLDGQAGV